MKRRTILTAVLLAAVAATIALAVPGLQGTFNIPEPVSGSLNSAKPQKTMRAFRSERELKDYFAELAAKQKRVLRRGNANAASNAAASPVAADNSLSLAKAEAKAEAREDDSVTNNQHAGVDEGGIVKVHGDHLVILRRGRLFTVRISDNSLQPVASTDAYPPGIDPSNDWYDEMLVSNDTVIVIGYSYRRGGTEINLFDIGTRGSLAYRSTYHLRSNDYYSSRNYASRLIGNKLIFYTPQYMGLDGDPTERFPAVRRWRNGATDNEFQSVVEPTSVYRADKPIGNGGYLALHTVTACDISNKNFSCSASSVLGAPGRVFYVSPTSVYVWATDWNYGEGGSRTTPSMLYRMPLDASAPSAIGVAGGPIDQFSFLESEDNHINVLVRADTHGEQMLGSEFSDGDVALFRAPVDSFSDGSLPAPSYRYREVPKVEGYTFQNRFVGDYVLYGTGSGWGAPQKKSSANLFAVNWAKGDVHELALKHGVDRIEQLGRDAVVVGTNGTDLHFSPIRLSDVPQVHQSFVRKNASQGETRSHGFFYKPDGRESGLLGLPIARSGRPGYRHLVEDSAAVIFLRNEGLDFSELGELGAKNRSNNDGCRASCIDWYGNARPLFLRNRVFALLGYEIVEGKLAGGRIEESRRINYSPRGFRQSLSE